MRGQLDHGPGTAPRVDGAVGLWFRLPIPVSSLIVSREKRVVRPRVRAWRRRNQELTQHMGGENPDPAARASRLGKVLEGPAVLGTGLTAKTAVWGHRCESDESDGARRQRRDRDMTACCGMSDVHQEGWEERTGKTLHIEEAAQ